MAPTAARWTGPSTASRSRLAPCHAQGPTTVASDKARASGETATAFTAAASGEWEGAAAAFNRAGDPVELPRAYVPEAFFEWGVELADWQTQCSTLAEADGAAVGLTHRLKRLMPSVGCEADATAFLDEGVAARLGGGGGGGGGGATAAAAAFPPAFLADGAYALAPPSLPSDPASPPARFEVSLPLPPAACVAANGSVAPRRVRAVLTVAADPVATPARPVLTGVELFSEKRYGDYNGGNDSLAGCGGGVGPFARTERVEATAVERADWSVVGGVAVSVTAGGATAAPTADAGRGSAPGRLLLPLGAWAAVRPVEGGDGGVIVEAGVVAKGSDDGTGQVRRSGAAEFGGDGTLVGVSLVAETAGGGRLE